MDVGVVPLGVARHDRRRGGRALRRDESFALLADLRPETSNAGCTTTRSAAPRADPTSTTTPSSDRRRRPSCAASPRTSATPARHDGDSVVLAVEGLSSWTFTRRDDRWDLFDGADDDPAATVELARADATSVLSRGRDKAGIADALTTGGDSVLAEGFVKGVASLASR